MKKVILAISVILSFLFVNAQTPVRFAATKINNVSVGGRNVVINSQFIVYVKETSTNVLYIKYQNPNKQGFTYYTTTASLDTFVMNCNAFEGTLLALSSVLPYKNTLTDIAVNVNYISTVSTNRNSTINALSVVTIDCQNGSEKLFISESPSDISGATLSLSTGTNLSLGNIVGFPFLTVGTTKLSGLTYINTKNIVYIELKNDSILTVAYENPVSLGLSYYTLSIDDTTYNHLNDYAPMFFYFPKSQIGKDGYTIVSFNLSYYGEIKPVLTPIKNIPSAQSSITFYLQTPKTIYSPETYNNNYTDIFDFIDTFTPAP